MGDGKEGIFPSIRKLRDLQTKGLNWAGLSGGALSTKFIMIRSFRRQDAKSASPNNRPNSKVVHYM